MNFITERLKKLVVAEATLLRQNTTDEERTTLWVDRSGFNPFGVKECVYGLMTGSSISDRAIGLKNRSAKPYSCCLIGFAPPLRSERFALFAGSRYFSPLEYYVAQRLAKNDSLIAYLTGQRDTLTIADL